MPGAQDTLARCARSRSQLRKRAAGLALPKLWDAAPRVPVLQPLEQPPSNWGASGAAGRGQVAAIRAAGLADVQQHRLANALCDLGNVRMQLGAPPQLCVPPLEEATALLRDSDGMTQRWDLTRALHSLAIAHAASGGDLDTAVAVMTEAVDAVRRLHDDGGCSSLDLVRSLEVLGDAHTRRREYEAALACHQQALELAESARAANADRGRCARLVGQSLMHLGREPEALPLLQQAVGLLVKANTTPRTHIDVAGAYVDEGECLFKLGKLSGAVKELKLGLAMLVSLHGTSGPDEHHLRCLDLLGKVLTAGGKPHKAIKYLQQGMAMERDFIEWERCGASTVGLLASVCGALAKVHADAGRMDVAGECVRRAVDLWRVYESYSNTSPGAVARMLQELDVAAGSGGGGASEGGVAATVVPITEPAGSDGGASASGDNGVGVAAGATGGESVVAVADGSGSG